MKQQRQRGLKPKPHKGGFGILDFAQSSLHNKSQAPGGRGSPPKSGRGPGKRRQLQRPTPSHPDSRSNDSPPPQGRATEITPTTILRRPLSQPENDLFPAPASSVVPQNHSVHQPTARGKAEAKNSSHSTNWPCPSESAQRLAPQMLTSQGKSLRVLRRDGRVPEQAGWQQQHAAHSPQTQRKEFHQQKNMHMKRNQTDSNQGQPIDTTAAEEWPSLPVAKIIPRHGSNRTQQGAPTKKAKPESRQHDTWPTKAPNQMPNKGPVQGSSSIEQNRKAEMDHHLPPTTSIPEIINPALGLEDWPTLPMSPAMHSEGKSQPKTKIETKETPLDSGQKKNQIIKRDKSTRDNGLVQKKSPGNVVVTQSEEGSKKNTEKMKSARQQFEESIKPLTPELNDNLFGGVMLKSGEKSILSARPKKRNLSTLKKRILQERMERHNKAPTSSSAICAPPLFNALPHVIISGLICADDVEDEDEFEEIVQDIQNILDEYGKLRNVFVPRKINPGKVFALYSEKSEITDAISSLNQMVVGGQSICAISEEVNIGQYFAQMWEVLIEISMESSLATKDKDMECLESLQSKAKEFGRFGIFRTSFSEEKQLFSVIYENQEEAKSFSDAVNKTKIGDSEVISKLLQIKPDTAEGIPSYGICIKGLVSVDELEDDDEYSEIVEDIKQISKEYGPIASLEVSRSGEDAGEVKVFYKNKPSRECAQQALHNRVIGGNSLHVTSFATQEIPSLVGNTSCRICIEGLVESEDLEDDEEYDEICSDIKEMAAVYGKVLSLEIPRDKDSTGRVFTTYSSITEAKAAVEGFSSRIVGGKQISATILETEADGADESAIPAKETDDALFKISIEGLIDMEDFEDDDEYDEICCNIKEMAAVYGNVQSLDIPRKGQGTKVFVCYMSLAEAKAATNGFSSKIVGGKQIVSTICEVPQCPSRADKSEAVVCLQKEVPPSTISLHPQSGKSVKYIPPKYAAVKDCPRLPKPQEPRKYSVQPNDAEINELVSKLLATLMTFQERSKERDPMKWKKRLVMGFREVKRGLKSGKINSLIIAPDVECGEMKGSLNDQIRDLINIAEDRRASGDDVDIIFALNKRKIGKALGKTIKISCVGVCSADGAFDVLKLIRKRLNVLAQEKHQPSK